MVVLALAALGVAVLVGVVRSAGSSLEVAPVPVTVETSSAGSARYVHVSGAVRSPGLYVLHGDARVVDAVASAGGFADDAESSAVNLARPVSDGEQLIVPRVGEAPLAGGVSASGDGRVNLNTADEAALDTLPRVGPAIAARIIAWREANGRFSAVEDLLTVPGIGPKMLESLRDLVTV